MPCVNGKEGGRVCVVAGEKGWEELSMRRMHLNTTQSKRSGRQREKMRWKLEGSVFAALSRLRKNARWMDAGGKRCGSECVCACWASAVTSVNVMGELLRAVRRSLCSLWGLYSQHVLVFPAVHTDALRSIHWLKYLYPMSHPCTSLFCTNLHDCFCVHLHPVYISEDLQPTVVSLLSWWLFFS